MRVSALSTLGIVVLALSSTACSGIPQSDVQPDLRAGAILLEPGAPDANDTVDVTVTFRNVGTSSNDLGFEVRVVVTRDGADVTEGQQRFEDQLEDDELAEVEFRNLLRNLQTGTYTITATIDADEELDEVDENNNVRSIDLTVSDG